MKYQEKTDQNISLERIIGMKKYIFEAGYSSFKETPEEERPRERLERLGAGGLRDDELLMLIIGSGNSGRAVDEIASDLLSLLDEHPEITREEIMLIPGLGKAKAAAIDAALELGRRRVRVKGRTITQPKDIFMEVRHYSSRSQESLIVVALNGAHESIGTIVATVGLLNKTIVHPREVFADAIKNRAAAIAIAHNHPSGNVEPSEDDKEVTRRLVQCGTILGIKVLDHVMFTLLIQSGF